jgi:hypothetical protein
LIATNTIGQGDTRSTGLRWICTHGGTIYAARRRAKWPGQAAVVVSVVNVTKGKPLGLFDLDGRAVPIITAYLFHAGGHEDPTQLQANAGKSFQGSIVLGMGFTFDDTNTDGVANSLSDMENLIANDPRNAKRIFPYLGGEELLDNPEHEHHRYVINFADWPLKRIDIGKLWNDSDDDERAEWLRRGIVPLDFPDPVAADYPDLLRVLEEKVKPERAKLGDNADARRRKEKWWLWGRYTPALFAAMYGKERVLALSRVGQQGAIAFQPTNIVPAESLVVFVFEEILAFTILQSRIHEIWARFFASSMKDDMRYTPSDCFETFPFPNEFESNDTLEHVGREYYEFRAALMVRNDEGLTKTYNRFHNPDERKPDILRLRELHAAMDRAVLKAYGWHDLAAQPKCEFLLDYEDEEDESEGPRRRRKPWRYRWPDEIRDEVLARLMALNAERAKEEQLAGEAADAQLPEAGRRPNRRNRSTISVPENQTGFEFEDP